MASSISGQWAITRAANYMTSHSNKISASVARLAGNTKFASGADNPSGMAFAQRTRSNATAATQASENLQSGQTVTKLAESAYSSIVDILSKAREIASQANNPSYSDDDIATAKSAIDKLYDQIKTVEGAATFNGTAILGNADGFTFQIGEDSSSQLSIANLAKASTTASAAPGMVKATDVPTAITKIDTHIAAVMNLQANIGAWDSALGYVNDFVSNKSAILQESAANAGNVNITTEMSSYVNNTIALQAAQFISAQQNQNAYSVLNLLK